MAYADGLIRAYNIHSYAVHYTLQREIETILILSCRGLCILPLSSGIYLYRTSTIVAVDSTIKLIGAGAFAFHPTLEWIFVGDRRGTLLAWDVSTERPSMIGM